MPRVENVGRNVDGWAKSSRGYASSTYDVCRGCNEQLADDPHAFDAHLQPYNPDEPQGVDGWAGDVSHPPYTEDECDGEYYCAVCSAALTDDDD